MNKYLSNVARKIVAFWDKKLIISILCLFFYSYTMADNKQIVVGKVMNTSVDSQFLDIYKLIAAQKYTHAINKLNDLLSQYPNFELAKTLKSDLLIITSKSNSYNQPTILNKDGLINLSDNANNDDNDNTINNSANNKKSSLEEEAKLRIKAIFERPDHRLIPSSILNLSLRQKTAFLVDPERSRMYVYENINGRPKFLFDYYITIGKKGFDKQQEGDSKTPLGVYDILPPIPKSKLPSMYGYAALPLTFPNDWDKMHDITGSNIWIHGVPIDTYNRAPKASEGCVVLTNTDIARLLNFTQAKSTPVIINKGVQWLDLQTWKKKRQQAMDLVQIWQDAWATYDFATYSKLYSINSFKSNKKTYEEWMKKYSIFFEQRQIVLQNIRNLSIYEYPNTDTPTLLVTFEQDMLIPNILSKDKQAIKQSIMNKRQYWQYDGINWEIVYENEI